MQVEKLKYPKVLIIGQSFHLKTGGGITLTNLFRGWDKECIAVAAEYIVHPSFEVCRNYYQLGSLEYELRFPFNILPGHKHSESRIISKEGNKTNHEKKHRARRPVIKSLYDRILATTGLIHLKRKFKISPHFQSWIKDFSPDIIYTQLSTLEQIRLVNFLRDELKLPVAIHIMDDWPSTIHEEYFPGFVWKRIIHTEFIDLIRKAKGLFSISNEMSKEYLHRYGLRFIPFHNPVIMNNWLPFSRSEWEVGKVFNILYTGRIGRANGKAIIFLAKIINAINQNELQFQLDIFTPDVDRANAVTIDEFKGVDVKRTLPYNEMPSLLASYDLLFLPLDFDRDGIRFAQFSMPTKTAEYMISGTPVLVFADSRTALAKYALQDKWAYLVTHNDKASVSEALYELRSNLVLRKKLALRARQVALQNEDANIVKEKFRNSLNFLLS